MLRNAEISFVDNSGKQDFTRDIKNWINKLVLEVKRVFPKFKQDMHEFFRGDEVSLSDDTEGMEYEISSKIGEHV
jgi:hypothetical protein